MIKALIRGLFQSVAGSLACCAAHTSKFAADTRAGVLIYVTITLPVIVGFALLAIDGSRFYSLHTSLQKGTDALSIAGAAELDTFPGAIIRSEHAIANIVANNSSFGDGASAIIATDVTTRYLSDIPADDATPIPGSMVIDTVNDTLADQKARYVEVTINPRQLTAIFPASFLGASNTAQAAAVSVAGNTQIVCKLMPLFICNPYETVATSIHDDHGLFAAGEDTQYGRLERRKLIHMKAAPGGTADYFPGDFGFLQGPSGPGAQTLADALAAGTAESCYAANGVETETGHKIGPVQTAINTRFGLYGNPGFKSEKNNPRYRPAKNVRKGQNQTAAKVCEDWTPDTPSNSMPFPKDKCFIDPIAYPTGCPAINGRMGNGDWTIDVYWTANFPLETGGAPGTFNTNVKAEASRYDIYRHEIDAAPNRVPTRSTGGENGDPVDNHPSPDGQCYTGGTLNDTPDRRLINGAILNCKALAAPGSGYNLKGHVDSVPVLAFAEFFIAQPMESGGGTTDRSLWVEFRRILRQGAANATAFDMVQMYR